MMNKNWHQCNLLAKSITNKSIRMEHFVHVLSRTWILEFINL